MLRDRLMPRRTACPQPESAEAWVRMGGLLVVGALVRQQLRGVHGDVARDGV